jgi:hypothetical protein
MSTEVIDRFLAALFVFAFDAEKRDDHCHIWQ